MFPSSGIFKAENKIIPDQALLNSIVITLTDYFVRKKANENPGYDPIRELNLFTLMLKGFALSFVYMDDNDDGYHEQTITDIIAKYK